MRTWASWTIALATVLVGTGCGDDTEGEGASGPAARAAEQATAPAGDTEANPSAEPNVEITVLGPGLEGETVFEFDPSGQGRLDIFSDDSGLYQVLFTDRVAAAQGSAELERVLLSVSDVEGSNATTQGFTLNMSTSSGLIRLDDDGSDLEWDIEALHGSATERVQGQVEGSRFAGSFRGTVPEKSSGDTYEIEGSFDVVD